MDPARSSGLEIDQDFDYQRRAWRLQRIGSAALFVFVIAALAGLLGSGPLSRAAAGVPGVFTLDYPRLTRYQDAETLVLRLRAAATVAVPIRVSLSREFIEAARITIVVPAPESVQAGADRVIFAFRAAEPGRPLEITFDFQPQRIGTVRARLRLESPGAPPREATFSQLTYP
jgi:hypothetical protein